MSNSSAPIQVNETLTNIQQIQFTDKTISLSWTVVLNDNFAIGLNKGYHSHRGDGF